MSYHLFITLAFALAPWMLADLLDFASAIIEDMNSRSHNKIPQRWVTFTTMRSGQKSARWVDPLSSHTASPTIIIRGVG